MKKSQMKPAAQELPHVAGLDGGGTGSSLVCLGPAGQVLLEAEFGPLNINSSSRADIQQSLRQVVTALSALPGGLSTCQGLCIATAGLSNQEAAPFFHQAVQKAGFAGPLHLVGDQEAALEGAVGGLGLVLVSGTGSICFGKNASGQTARSGGFGHLVDDGGSGYAIGRDIISQVLKAADGRGPQTVLTKQLYQALNLQDIPALLTFVYRPGRDKGEIAALAPLLEPALQQGDDAAHSIAAQAVSDLAQLCSPVLAKLGLQKGPLALMGGVLTHNAYLAEWLQEVLLKRHPGLIIQPPRHKAAHGAASLAAKAFAFG